MFKKAGLYCYVYQCNVTYYNSFGRAFEKSIKRYSQLFYNNKNHVLTFGLSIHSQALHRTHLTYHRDVIRQVLLLLLFFQNWYLRKKYLEDLINYLKYRHSMAELDSNPSACSLTLPSFKQVILYLCTCPKEIVRL